MVDSNRGKILSLFLLGLLVACQRGPDVASPAVVATPFSLKEISVGTTASDATQAHPNVITVDDPIVVTIKTVGEPASPLLSARLVSLRTGQAVGTADVQLSRATQAPITLQFPAAHAAGRYVLEIKVGDKVMASRDVDIMRSNREAPTPPAP